MALTEAEIQVLSDNVDRGAEWFEMVYPEWNQTVDFSNFDMSNTGLCVAGHVFGTDSNCKTGFDNLFGIASMAWDGWNSADQFMRDHGFELPCADIFYKNEQESWEILENLWLKKAMQ
jgi:hypothetical protein